MVKKNLSKLIEYSPEERMEELKKKFSQGFEESSFKRMALEHRFFLNKSNTKWMSIGVVPVFSGKFTVMARLYDAKGFFMNFTPQQFVQLFKLLRHIPELSSKLRLDNSDTPLKPIQNFYFVKTGFNDTCVYTLKNISSEDKKEMALGIVTLERLLVLEHALRKTYDTALEEYTLSATAVLEKFVTSSDEVMSIQDERAFKAKVNEFLSNLCKLSSDKLLAPLPPDYRNENVHDAILDMACNFSDFIANHLIYERQLCEADVFYETLSTIILNERHN